MSPSPNTLTASALPIIPADPPENSGLEAEGMVEDPIDEVGASGPGPSRHEWGTSFPQTPPLGGTDLPTLDEMDQGEKRECAKMIVQTRERMGRLCVDPAGLFFL